MEGKGLEEEGELQNCISECPQKNEEFLENGDSDDDDGSSCIVRVSALLILWPINC